MKLHILIDSSSIQNFLGFQVTQKLGCNFTTISPMKVVVANGQDMNCEYACIGFKWLMQGRMYLADVLLISLDNYAMVPGV